MAVISTKTDAGALNGDELIYVIDDPAGTPADHTTTPGAISTYVNTALSLSTTYQPLDAELTAIAGLVSAADSLPYFTGLGTAALATFTAAGRALVDDADAAAQRTTLGLGTVATYNVPAVGDAAVGEAVIGSDSRLTDSRTPASHASSHNTGGGDAISALAGSVITSGTVGAAYLGVMTGDSGAGGASGAVPAPAAGDAAAGKFLKADGTWTAVSAGSGDVVGPASATNSAVALFDTTTGKLLKNSAVTVTNAATGSDLTVDLSNGYMTQLTTSYGMWLDVSTGGSVLVGQTNTARMGLKRNAISFERGVGDATIGWDQNLDDHSMGNLSVSAQSATAAATTYIAGGTISISGGAGASSSAGAANGGSVYLDGGQGYGTGVNGDIYVGATRGYMVFPGGLRVIGYTTTASAPTTTEFPNDKDCGVHEDTGGGAFYFAFNRSGTIYKVALT